VGLRQKFLAAWVSLTLVLLVCIGAMLLTLWVDLSAEEQAVLSRRSFDHVGLLVVMCLLIALICFAVVGSVLRAYAAPASKLVHAIRIIQTANPNYRAVMAGASEMKLLASRVNSFAENYSAL
jgi:nitrate/nitrite-specific signal transduction histidine kinase